MQNRNPMRRWQIVNAEQESDEKEADSQSRTGIRRYKDGEQPLQNKNPAMLSRIQMLQDRNLLARKQPEVDDELKHVDEKVADHRCRNPMRRRRTVCYAVAVA